MRRLFSAMLYLFPPGAAILLASPLVGQRPVDWTTTMVVAPLYLGLGAAPGYVYCWAVNPRAMAVSAAVRWWIRGSLFAALAASIGGMVAALWMVLFLLPAVPTAILTLRLWWKFEQRASRTITEVSPQ